MKLIFTFLILVLCLGITECAYATDSYLCIGSKITGFIYDIDTKTCRTVTEESYNIYIVERHNNPEYMWGIRKPGERGFSHLCNEDFNKFGYLSCDIIGNFRMFKKNLVFLNSYLEDSCHTTAVSGQLSTAGGRSISFIEIGSCHPF